MKEEKFMAMIKLGCSISSIARHIKRSKTTIYNELKRGTEYSGNTSRRYIVFSCNQVH